MFLFIVLSIIKNSNKLAEHTSSENLKPPFIELESIDSTNNYAFMAIREGLAVSGYSVFAHAQYDGKGQRGKQWHTTAGEAIHLSMVFKPALSVYEGFSFQAFIASAIIGYLQKKCTELVLVKWPNDIFIGEKKLGGILIENLIVGKQWKWSVVGIGLNINQRTFPMELPNATSLFKSTGTTHPPAEMAKELAATIYEKHIALTPENAKLHLAHYLNCLYKKNENATFKKGSRTFTARIKTVTSRGELVLQIGSLEESFKHGEIEWVL